MDANAVNPHGSTLCHSCSIAFPYNVLYLACVVITDEGTKGRNEVRSKRIYCSTGKRQAGLWFRVDRCCREMGRKKEYVCGLGDVDRCRHCTRSIVV